MKGISRTCGYDDNRSDEGKKLHESCMSHLNASALYPIGIVNVKSFVSKNVMALAVLRSLQQDSEFIRQYEFFYHTGILIALTGLLYKGRNATLHCSHLG